MEQINNSVLDGSNIEASKRLDELIKEIEQKSDRPLPIRMDKIITQLDGGTLEERLASSKEFLGLDPDQSFQDIDIDVNEDRENHNKKPLKPIKFKKETKEIKKSTTSW